MDPKYVWWTSPIQLWPACSLLRGGGGLGGLLSNPSTTPCLALRSQGHPLLKRRPAAAKDALDVSPQLSTSSGQIEQRSRAGKINLHYPPLVIHLLIAQNLWPPLIAGICLVDPKLVVQQTGWWWHKHRSNYCIAGTPHCSLATWLSGVHGIYWLSAGPTVSTLASPVPAQRYAPKCHLGTFTKMHSVHTRIHRWTNAGPFSHKWQSTKYRFVTKMTKQLYVPNR